MPTIPLYTPPSPPDLWHHLRAPGGYECWHLDVEDPSASRVVIAMVCLGDPWNDEYRRRYTNYRRRPTRNVPPVPREYPLAYVIVADGGRVRERHVRRFDPIRAVRAHESGIIIEFEGVIRAQTSGSTVHAVVTVDSDQLVVRGPGYLDHVFSTEPPGLTMAEQTRGRILLESGLAVFSDVVRRDGTRQTSGVVRLENPQVLYTMRGCEGMAWDASLPGQPPRRALGRRERYPPVCAT